MRALIVGSGGREHAIAWWISRASGVAKIYCTPGNAGIARIAECVDTGNGGVANLADWASRNRIDLTVVGPEAPLVAGIVDEFRSRGLAILGPTGWAAQIEGSKLFAKQFMDRWNVPTAGWRAFSDVESAVEFVRTRPMPVVVKADGLAAGKGVIVASSPAEAESALVKLMVEGQYGEAGKTVIVEEFMQGQEASILGLCDGDHFALLPPAQDHKRLFDGDRGPNTGGMGAYSPVPVVDERMVQLIADRIFEPVLAGFRQTGHPYTGVLYAGLMLTVDGPKVVEFNCRLGDPEAQAVLPRLESDPVELLNAAVSGGLEGTRVKLKSDACATVVMASKGYPEDYLVGMAISGVERAATIPGVNVFHSATEVGPGGELLTGGGRVLAVSALGSDLESALDKAYQGVSCIHFEGAHYRRDIGSKALPRIR